MLAREIRDNWLASASGYAAVVTTLQEVGYVAWTIKTSSSYGVALPIDENAVVSEKFAGAYLYTDTLTLNGDKTQSALVLLTQSDDILIPFSALCAELINPGEHGEFRKEIEESPVSWWMQWKELLGNKNVDDRVYDVLGELCTLKYLASRGITAEWNGPTGSTYDIDCDGCFYEVKSSTARNKREITLSNHFQLDPPADATLRLVFCQFESALAGLSINSVLDELIALGYSSLELEKKLDSLGLEKGKSARNRKYMMHAMLEYMVDDSFPAIKDISFIDGHLPKGVQSITYTVSLDNLDSKNLLIE